MSEIWVVGEALIDLMPVGKSTIPIVGGGPANVAKALSRLGFDTSLICGISTDRFGELIREELRDVNLSKAIESELPTATAKVTLDSTGSAIYEFALNGTATFEFRSDWLPSGKPEVVYIGTLATVVEPGASNLHEWASRLEAPIVFDPNVRPSVLGNKAKYREIFKRWASISTVVKMSKDDQDWLEYSKPEELFDFGIQCLIITKGSEGIVGLTKDKTVSVASVPVEVKDTVGAGDTVAAVVVEGISSFGVKELEKNLVPLLSRAAKAAAITCSRTGAKPPTLAELD